MDFEEIFMIFCILSAGLFFMYIGESSEFSNLKIQLMSLVGAIMTAFGSFLLIDLIINKKLNQ